MFAYEKNIKYNLSYVNYLTDKYSIDLQIIHL